MILPKELDFNWKAAKDDIVTAIRYHMRNTGSESAVIGLSGGVDSSVAAFLAAEAIGKNRLHGYLLPESDITPREDLEDAMLVAKLLGIPHETIEISSLVDAFQKRIPEITKRTAAGKLAAPLAVANLKARIRMVILYAQANFLGNAQVVGTGDKSELLLGYSTKYGDHGVDFLPLGDLYKSQVRFLAAKLGLPDRIWKKAPSPRLLRGQTAESEIGVGYDVIDRVLFYRVEERYPEERIAEELNLPKPLITRLCTMVIRADHKRKSPPICKIGPATINWDWRMPTE